MWHCMQYNITAQHIISYLLNLYRSNEKWKSVNNDTPHISCKWKKIIWHFSHKFQMKYFDCWINIKIDIILYYKMLSMVSSFSLFLFQFRTTIRYQKCIIKMISRFEKVLFILVSLYLKELYAYASMCCTCYYKGKTALHHFLWYFYWNFTKLKTRCQFPM